MMLRHIIKCLGLERTRKVKSSEIGDFTKWQDEAEFEKALKELVDALNAGRVDIKPPSFL